LKKTVIDKEIKIMWDIIMQYASESGIWAVLFVSLFFIQIKDSKTREEKYQSTIDTLAEKLSMISDIKEDVETLLKMTTTSSTIIPTDIFDENK
jgi:hypothetical protein